MNWNLKNIYNKLTIWIKALLLSTVINGYKQIRCFQTIKDRVNLLIVNRNETVTLDKYKYNILKLKPERIFK